MDSNIPALLTSLLWMAFLVWMIVDCLRTTGSYTWAVIIIFFPPAAIYYFVIYVLPTLDLTLQWERLVAGQRRIREIKAQIHNMDRPYHWTKLGDEYRNRRRWDDAAQCYDEALQREKDNEEARYGLGLVRLRQQRWEEALDLLEPLAGDDPGYAFGEGTLAVARAWRGLGRPEKAIRAYETLMSRYTYPDAQYEFAELLFTDGNRDKAVALLRQLVADGRNATGFSSARERRWGRKAKLFLKTHAH